MSPERGVARRVSSLVGRITHPLGLALILTLITLTAPALAQPATLRVPANGPNAYSYPSPVLDRLERRAFSVGNAFFKQNWVAAPSSTPGRDGLGPLFNASSCSACHLRDGRAQPSFEQAARPGMIYRLGDSHPTFGSQVQDFAIPGHSPEATIDIHRHLLPGSYPDGSSYTLEHLSFHTEPAIPLAPRIAPAIIGMGLLESITASQLAKWASSQTNGVSGRIHFLPNHVIGRFGWKASQPSTAAQVATAFAEDIGITTNTSPPDIDAHKLARVTFYSQHLAVPEPAPDPDGQGLRLFTETGCATCHIPALTLDDRAIHPGYRHQTIAPYTDLLLHDMGPDLADPPSITEGDAAPSEWRTPPLWGLHHLAAVSQHTRLLHDGRARNIEEAILWHGGEASRARDRFKELPAAQRQALINFVGGR